MFSGYFGCNEGPAKSSAVKNTLQKELFVQQLLFCYLLFEKHTEVIVQMRFDRCLIVTCFFKYVLKILNAVIGEDLAVALGCSSDYGVGI